MKKLIFIISFLLAIQYMVPCFCAETNETIKNQEEVLGISDFIKEAEEYTKDSFEEIDLKTIYKNAISGKISAEGIGKRNSKSFRN